MTVEVSKPDRMHEEDATHELASLREESARLSGALDDVCAQSEAALDELTRILRLGSVYDFQRTP